MKKQNNPLISVVTVSYNAVATIEQTILSVINQIYSNLEYVIIDGGSTDGTVDIIKKYADRIAYWVSEPDEGIYDAMNKGVSCATGDWVNFMNSGDEFYDEAVLEEVFARDLSSYSVVFGKTVVKQKWGTYVVIPDRISVLQYRMPFYHQSTFVRLSCLQQFPFDLNYKITADYNVFHTLYDKKFVFYYHNGIVSIYDSIFGVSSRNLMRMNAEMDEIAKSPGTLFDKFCKLRLNIIACLPESLAGYLYGFYYFLHRRFQKYNGEKL